MHETRSDRAVAPLPEYGCLDLGTLDPEDREFFFQDADRSKRFIAKEPDRQKYNRLHPARVLKFRCVDEREGDTSLRLGIPLGAANYIETAGNRFGVTNLAVRKEIQYRIDQAVSDGKRVLLLMIMHESSSNPDTQSCAAWGNSRDAANSYAMQRVLRFNQGYVDRKDCGAVTDRWLVAVRLTSITDTEARKWHGDSGTVDPTEFVQLSNQRSNALSNLEGDRLFTAVMDRFVRVFPYGQDQRFEGLCKAEWQELLSQMATMCSHNVLEVRRIMAEGLSEEKAGHKGTRIFVGRGFDMYPEPGQQLLVSDFSRDYLGDTRIGLIFATANRLILAEQDFQQPLRIPIYVNITYDPLRKGDRGGSINHVTDVASELRADLDDLFSHPTRRAEFDERVFSALKHEGVEFRNGIRRNHRLWYFENIAESIDVVASISSKTTRRLEPIAKL